MILIIQYFYKSSNDIFLTETHQDVGHGEVDNVDVGGALHVFSHQDDHHHERVASYTGLERENNEIL